jgi:exodeoxyribonuclease V alpha subunit
LIYTGITRAKSDVAVWGDRETFVAAVSRRIDRKSGLNDAFWMDSPD